MRKPILTLPRLKHFKKVCFCGQQVSIFHFSSKSAFFTFLSKGVCGLAGPPRAPRDPPGPRCHFFPTPIRRTHVRMCARTCTFSRDTNSASPALGSDLASSAPLPWHPSPNRRDGGWPLDPAGRTSPRRPRHPWRPTSGTTGHPHHRSIMWSVTSATSAVDPCWMC